MAFKPIEHHSEVAAFGGLAVMVAGVIWVVETLASLAERFL